MRIDAKFASERKSEEHDFIPKFIIVSEGSETEPKYFAGLNKSILTDNIEVVNLLRDFSKITNSHPKHLINVAKEFFLNQEEKMKIGEFKERISNYLIETEKPDQIESVKNKISIIHKNDDHQISFEEVPKILIEIFKYTIYSEMINEFELYIKSQNITYSPYIDSVNIVVDRDRQNFKEDQYKGLINECKCNNINLYVSNPCFELWLLMHVDNFEKFSSEKLFENGKVNKHTKFLEKCLKDNLKSGYKKGNIDFSKFEPCVNKAIKRSKEFETDIELLENTLGTNVGILVEKMIEKNSN